MKRISLFLWSYCRQDPIRFWILVVAMVFAGGSSALYPIIFKNIIDLTTAGSSETILDQIYGWVWIFFSIIAIQQLGWKTMEFVVIKFQWNLLARMYKDMFVQSMQHSYRFFSDNMSGTIIKRVSRLVDTTEAFLDMFFMQIIRYGVGSLLALVVLYFSHPLLALFGGIWMVLVFFLKKNLWKWKMKYNLDVAEAQSHVSGVLSDSITNHFTVLITGSTKQETKQFFRTVANWSKKLQKSWLIDNFIFIVSSIMIVSLQIGVIVGGVHLWWTATITVGTLVLMITYLGLFIDMMIQLNFMFRSIYRMAGDMIETLDVLEQPHEIVDTPKAKKLQITSGAIAFEDITFAYKDEVIFKDFSLSIAPGEKVGLVGVSGSGKSTLVKLLFRFYDLHSGSITVDGQNIANVQQETLRRSIGMVPQEPLLFHRTIAENIAYSKPDSTQKQIEQAAKKAGAHDFIKKLTNGYDTLVGERGVKLSGGERQRVAIARTILEDAPIFVLDEATSALDSESEKKIQHALEDVFTNKTAIVIAHRLSTIMKMDRIVVLKKGKIVEQGTHADLINRENSVYKHLWSLQSGEFIDDMHSL